MCLINWEQNIKMFNEIKPIPVSAARQVADEHGYDQIIIIGRKVGNDGGESVATYGVDVPNCNAAAQIGDYLRYTIMGWPKDE